MRKIEEYLGNSAIPEQLKVNVDFLCILINWNTTNDNFVGIGYAASAWHFVRAYSANTKRRVYSFPTNVVLVHRNSIYYNLQRLTNISI